MTYTLPPKEDNQGMISSQGGSHLPPNMRVQNQVALIAICNLLTTNTTNGLIEDTGMSDIHMNKC